jgi:hypothetical protein
MYGFLCQEVPSDVSISDDTHKEITLSYNQRGSKLQAIDLLDGATHGLSFKNFRYLLACKHDFSNFNRQALTQASTWVKLPEVTRFEVTLMNQRNRQGITYGQKSCGACSRGNSEWAGLTVDPNVDHNVAVPAQGRIHLPGQCNQSAPNPF